MHKIKLLSAMFILPVLVKSQDSTKTKWVHHEIGFNTVSLIKQVISNNPATTLPQLPYDFFYNAYFKDKVGTRLGTGFNSSYIETVVPNQPYPRMTTKYSFSGRAGVSYNFATFKRVTINAFADYIRSETKDETITTVTVQTFPNPTQRVSTEATDRSQAEGAQAGVGVRFALHKNLALYTEAPFAYSEKVANTIVNINDTGISSSSVSTVRSATFQFFIPTTVYLVLRF